MWCPGIAYGEMVQHKHAPEDIPCHNHCFGGFLCLNFGGPFTICLANRAIREKEGIDGNVFTGEQPGRRDCVVVPPSPSHPQLTYFVFHFPLIRRPHRRRLLRRLLHVPPGP